MSRRSHASSSRGTTAQRRRQREEDIDVIRREYGEEEARRITAELERDDLAQRLAELQREFDEFCRRTLAPPPERKPLEPILQDALPPPPNVHPPQPLPTDPVAAGPNPVGPILREHLLQRPDLIPPIPQGPTTSHQAPVMSYPQPAVTSLPIPHPMPRWHHHASLQMLSNPSHEQYDPFHPAIHVVPTQASRPQSHYPDNNHPFTSKIMAAPLPPHFKPPTHIDLYDGTTNPQDHLESFRASMLLSRASDPIMCRAFSTTLKKAGLRWFTTLPPHSIGSFKQLAEAFYTNFTTSRAPKKMSAALVNF